MRKKDFSTLATELNDHLSAARHEFFAKKGLAFDEAAFWRQASTDRETFINEMIFFGADKFPIRPDDEGKQSQTPH